MRSSSSTSNHPPISQDPYHPTAKPPKDVNFIGSFISTLKKNHCYSFLFLTFICTISYLFGFWNKSIIFSTVTVVTAPTPTLPCNSSVNTTTTNSIYSSSSPPIPIDFTVHHMLKFDVHTVTETETTKLYPPCDIKYSEYTPCHHQKRSLKFRRSRLIFRERHCPTKQSELLKCRIPAPYGYKSPFKWPISRDYAWYNNVPHKHLTVEKAGQNWIRYEKDRFRFPGGGTMFPNGADAYIRDIGRLIDLKSGEIRTAIDTGCGVASWGAYLLSRNILPISFAPKDTHEAQVQFALERGVPALIGIMATKRLPYPSRAFDMAHCSRCLIPWAAYDGAYLIEVDRILRPGGYWILSGPPINWKRHYKGWERSKDDLSNEQKTIERVAKSLCWTKFIEKGDIAIWRKPINHENCKKFRKVVTSPQFCAVDQDTDQAWYTEMECCLTKLPEILDNTQVSGGKLAKWPKRLYSVPPRIRDGTIEGVTRGTFLKDSELWKRRVAYYKARSNQLNQRGRYRNLLDMNAHLGGFAAALVDDPVWVMNVVPVEAKLSTLGVVYERGLIGTYQSWCEAMSTYPRTYDLIHADSIFTLYEDKCEIEDILLEMDRILRPEGSVIIREDVEVLLKVKKITDALNWDGRVMDHEDGPLVREKLLFAVKTYWTAPSNSTSVL